MQRKREHFLADTGLAVQQDRNTASDHAPRERELSGDLGVTELQIRRCGLRHIGTSRWDMGSMRPQVAIILRP